MSCISVQMEEKKKRELQKQKNKEGIYSHGNFVMKDDEDAVLQWKSKLPKREMLCCHATK